MIESVQIRQRGAYDYETHYDNLCALQDSCPLPAVKAHLAQGVLDLNGDRIRVNDWMPVLNTLRINKSLEFVAVRSYYTPPTEDNEKKALIEKRKTPSVRSKEITYRMCKSLKECLGVTPTLTCLELQGLPLRERDLNTLMKGLTKNNTLSHFSLEYCRIGDAGLEVICKGLKNSSSINSVNFTGCSLTSKGGDALGKVIKHQGTRRHNEAWRDSLRYRRPDLDRMPGIRRITINNNPMLGDTGAVLLAEALKDDLWLKALDMQGCGISSTGAKSLLDVLKYNTTLVVLDVRRNPLIDRDIVHAIMEQLMINCNGQDTEYKWIKAEEHTDPSRHKHGGKKRTKTLNSSFGRKTTIKITPGAARRRTRSAGAVAVSRKLQPISSEGVKAGPGLPWRTAARANRYRGYPPEHIPGHSSLLEQSEGDQYGSPNQSASVIIMRDDSGEDEDEDEDSLQELERLKLDDSALVTGVKANKGVKLELMQLSRHLQEERLARSKAEQRVVELTMDNKKLREENSRFRRNKGGILDDDSVLESIEASFKQFHQFLDLLRESGLGQLISMAGLDAQGSPFYQLEQEPSFNFSRKGGTKSNGFLGDIKSAGQANDSFGYYGKDQGLTREKSRPSKPYMSSNDPTMQSSYLDESTGDNDAKTRRDELYDRILQETSNAFKHLSDANETVDTTQMQQNTTAEDDDRKPHPQTAPKPDKAKREAAKHNSDKLVSSSENLQGLRGTEGEIIMSLSPFDMDEDQDVSENFPQKSEQQDDDSRREIDNSDAVHKRPTSGVSDYNYSMDSYEQSYVSERGEVVHLGEEYDMYPESPSPIGPQSEEDDF